MRVAVDTALRGTAGPHGSAGAAPTGHDPHYKWIALSNTTLGMLMATINSSIVLIALPDIFRGIGIDPLAAENTGYLLWMLMGYLVVTAVLVVELRAARRHVRPGADVQPRLRRSSRVVVGPARRSRWMHGDAAALWLIGWRVVQGIGGALLMANSTAILTDAFPADQRGIALGINGVAAIAGSFLGLVIGGLLGPIDWRLVFLVSVPFGVFGTVWAYLKLREHRRAAPGRDRLVGQRHLRRRPDRGARRHHLRHPALRRPRHGLDQPVRAGLRCSAAAPCWSRSCSSRRRVGRPACSDLVAVPDPRRSRAGNVASLLASLGPRRPAVHADHLAAGHLAAAARLQLRARPRCGPASTCCR